MTENNAQAEKVTATAAEVIPAETGAAEPSDVPATAASTTAKPGSPDYPLHTELTIGEYFRQQVEIDPDHDFIVYPDRNLRWTYRDFDERTNNLAKGLLAIGMKPGDHLGIWARNIPDWLTLMFATAKVGIVLVTMNPSYKSHELVIAQASDMTTLCIIDAWAGRRLHKIIANLFPRPQCEPRASDFERLSVT